VDMNSSALSFPLKYFAQQEVLNTIAGGGTGYDQQYQINLTGFRAGEVRDIMLWLEYVPAASDNLGSANQWYWYPLQNTELRYNGEIFFTAKGSCSQLWNLVEDKKIPGVDTLQLDVTANPTTASAVLSTWTLIKFSQVDVPRDRMYDLVSGKPILNAVVNLSFNLPAEIQTELASSGSKAVLHAVYMYNCSLLFSRGTSEYIF